MEEILKDERFKHIFTDPTFRKIPSRVQKISVDKRFKQMFKDRKFKEKYVMDKRGRPINLTSSEDLKKLYNLASDDNSSEVDDDEKSEDETTKRKQKKSKNKTERLLENQNKKAKSRKDKVNNKKCDKISKVKKQNLDDQNENDVEKNILENEFNNDDKCDLKQSKTKKKNNCDLVKESSLKGKKKISYNMLEENGSDPNEDDTEKNKLENVFNENEKYELKYSEKTKKKISPKQVKELLLKEKNQKKKVSLSMHKENSSDESSHDEELSHLENTPNDASSSDEESDDDDHNISEENEDLHEENFSHLEATQDDASSSDEESDDDDDDVSEENDFDHRWEELQHDAPDANEITNRLAVCNMDWDRIRAEDLFAAFDSFKPNSGGILSVKIYPSEFGLKRMEEERLNGPAELVEKKLNLDEKDIEDKKTSKYHREKLRQYQINRLKYYYAVVECDTPETANHLYEELNGMEYESSSIRFDLRFIPNDITFDHEPKSIAEKCPDPTEYKPRLFTTTALQQVKVNLTWDETDPKRRETIQKAFTEPESIEKDIREYLASSSGESEDEADFQNEENKTSFEERIAKYKNLLKSLEEKETKEEEKYDIEITWEPGLKEKTEKLVKERLENSNLTPFEETLKKQKEKNKKKKQALRSQKSDDENSDMSSENCFNTRENLSKFSKLKDNNDEKKIGELALMMSDSFETDNLDNNSKRKGKRKRPKEQENSEHFQCDVKDPRFSAIYTSHLYNIDPSDPHFKSTKGNVAIIEEKQKKLQKLNSITDFTKKKKQKINL